MSVRSTVYRGANHWPVLAQRREQRRSAALLTPEQVRAARLEAIRRAEAAVPDVWSSGEWLADCRECMDFPRRFGTELGRDLWADEHHAMTLHRIGLGHIKERIVL